MTGIDTPGALAGATKAGKPCYASAAGTRNLANGRTGGSTVALRLAPFAALDPAALAALGLVAARLGGALA